MMSGMGYDWIFYYTINSWHVPATRKCNLSLGRTPKQWKNTNETWWMECDGIFNYTILYYGHSWHVSATRKCNLSRGRAPKQWTNTINETWWIEHDGIFYYTMVTRDTYQQQLEIQAWKRTALVRASLAIWANSSPVTGTSFLASNASHMLLFWYCFACTIWAP